MTKKDSPCFIASGGRLNVNGCTFNQGGKLGVLDGADTRATFTGNMGKDALTVVSHIGDRAVFGTNNPPVTIAD